ncbi:DUF2953 domain-containing protein [Paenibacillus albiflavus]|nr:DUF2953 domain-containing protein [Paenibacillus albiflavus]
MGLLLLWILLVIGVGMIIISITFIEVKVIAKRDHKDDQIIVDIKALWGLVKFRYEVPAIQLLDLGKGILFKKEQINDNTDKEMSASTEALNKRVIMHYIDISRQLLKSTKGLIDWFKQLLSRVECTTLSWNSRIGLDDAAFTAQVVGIVWGIKSMLIGYLIRYVQMKQTPPQLEVMPQYNMWDYSTEIKITIRIRIIYLIVSACNLLIRILKMPKGLKVWFKVLARKRKMT